MMASFPTQTGTVLCDRYVLQNVVHSDHWSWTILALRQTDRQLVILKIPGPGSTQSGASIAFHAAWMQRVFQSLSQIHHPNRVAVLDYLESHGLPILVQQQVAGTPLSQRLVKTPLAEREAIAMMRKIAIALSGIHGKGLIHRNVRPETIIERTDRTALGQTVLTDWGLQPSVFPANRASSYAAPEQFQPGGRFQPAIDVYGLAATLYALVTGQPPLHAALREKSALILPRQLQPELSVPLERAILQGMALNPQERPPSMGAWLGLVPEVTMPPVAPPRDSRSSRPMAARSGSHSNASPPVPPTSTGPGRTATKEPAPTINIKASKLHDSDPSKTPTLRDTSAPSAPRKPMKTLVTISLTAATLGALGGMVLRVATPESVAGISSLGRSQNFPELDWPGEGIPDEVPFDVPEPEQRFDAEIRGTPNAIDAVPQEEAPLREVVDPEEAEEAPVLNPGSSWEDGESGWIERDALDRERWSLEAEQQRATERPDPLNESTPSDNGSGNRSGNGSGWDSPATNREDWNDGRSGEDIPRESDPSSIDPYSGAAPEPVYDAPPVEETPYPEVAPEPVYDAPPIDTSPPPTLDWGDPVPPADVPFEPESSPSLPEEFTEDTTF